MIKRRTWLTSLVVLACAKSALLVFGAAHADIAPPRIEPYHPPDTVPGAVKVVMTDLTKALEKSDEAAFKAHCDERGWETNLVGGSGGTVKSIFDQGARKRWGLVRHGAGEAMAGGRVVIVPMDVKAFEGGKVLDQMFVLFVKADIGWRVLGAGEKLDQVRALGHRVAEGAALAPPAEKVP